jgi:serine/threonine-protein kinase PRP4
VLKICDLGTAIDKTDAATAHMDVTPYLVSRFYRAPEIILGIPYDYAVDMWSIGCTLYEMYTGKILFAGDSNNQMLKAIMEIRGRLTPKLFKRGQLSPAHFDDKGQFVSIERDKVLGKVCCDSIHSLPLRCFCCCFLPSHSLHLPTSAIWPCSWWPPTRGLCYFCHNGWGLFHHGALRA